MDIRLGTILEDGIVADILLQLPVKSLLRLKCVSKSWYSFISAKEFVKAHLQKSEHLTTFLISGDRKPYVIHHYPVDWLFRQRAMIFWPTRRLPQQPNDDADAVQFGIDYPVSDLKPGVISCCNGLCCMLIDVKNNIIILWNPSTRKSYKLPALQGYHWITSIWFGYDEPNDDYKVLVTGRPYSRSFNLYSLKTNSWKTVDNFLGPDPLIDEEEEEGEGVFVNNKLHWIRKIDCQIVGFNFEMEGVELVEQPSSSCLFTSLGVLQGCLCALGNDKEIWIMKEYGVKESWCRLATIPYHFRIPGNVFWPLCARKDGKILFYQESSLFVYNPKDNFVRSLRITNFTGRLHDIGFYIQSLVSPFPDKEKII